MIFRSTRTGRYRDAGELGNFLFCQRAWKLEQQSVSSEREPERAAGTAYHQQHGKQVRVAARTGAVARWALIFAILLLVWA